MFGAYSLGKAQELIATMNEIGIAPAVSKNISKLNKVYENFGVDLKYDEEEAEKGFEDLLKESDVGIVENYKLNDIASRITMNSSRKVFTAVATGFAKVFKFDANVQFALSDHADFSQALEYLEKTNPKLVYTVGKEAGIMANNLKKKGYESKAANNNYDFFEMETLKARIDE